METFSRNMAYSMLALLGSLPVGSVLAGVIYGLFAGGAGEISFLDSLRFALLFSIPAILVGAAPAFLYGAPAYAFAASRGYGNYLVACVIGALPALLSWNDLRTAFMLGLYGVSVACLTHLLVSLRARHLGHSSDNSSKPTPPGGGT